MTFGCWKTEGSEAQTEETLDLTGNRNRSRGDLPGTPKDMGPPDGELDLYHFPYPLGRFLPGVGLGNSMGKGVPIIEGFPENP